MVVLTRKVGQRLLLGGNIAVTVVAVDGERVRLGIEAPEDVQVLRAELLQEIATANREAVHPGSPLLARLAQRLAPEKREEPSPSSEVS